MPLPIYLAMTASEFRHCDVPASHCGYMACHFSPYASGLTNFPDTLPEQSLLFVNDSTPPHGHDPDIILQQLQKAVQRLSPCGIVFDFQRPDQPEIRALVEAAAGQLSCPAAVTPFYCEGWKGAVLVPPVPLYIEPETYLSPWQDREIWLECENIGTTLRVHPDGCTESPGICPSDSPVFSEPSLYCHYSTKLCENGAEFSLFRTDEDHRRLLKDVRALGVCLAMGLYQQWQT